jgi:hypothetical protein
VSNEVTNAPAHSQSRYVLLFEPHSLRAKFFSLGASNGIHSASFLYDPMLFNEHRWLVIDGHGHDLENAL